MSDLDENLDDRFSHDGAQIEVRVSDAILSLYDKLSHLYGHFLNGL